MNGATARRAGPQAVPSGYVIKPDDGLLEIRSVQYGGAKAGYVYTTSPLPDEYLLTFNYTLLRTSPGHERGQCIVSVSADDLTNNLDSPLAGPSRWYVNIRQDMGTYIGYRDADGEMRWWNGGTWGDKETRLINCEMGDTVTFKFSKDENGLCRLFMTNGKQSVSTAPVAASETQLGDAPEAFVVGDPAPGWNAGSASFLFSPGLNVEIESLGDQWQGVLSRPQMRFRVSNPQSAPVILKASLSIFEGEHPYGSRVRGEPYLGSQEPKVPAQQRTRVINLPPGGTKSVSIGYRAPEFEFSALGYPEGWMTLTLSDASSGRELYRSTQFWLTRFRLGLRFRQCRESLDKALLAGASRPGLAAHCQRLVDLSDDTLRNIRRAHTPGVTDIQPELERVWRWNTSARTVLNSYREGIPVNTALLAQVQRGDLDYIAYTVPNVTGNGERILPGSVPLLGENSNMLSMRSCRGEYEPASFALHAYRHVGEVRVRVSPLKGHKGVIPAAHVDVRLVKCWYQHGVECVGGLHRKVLTPELLLYDNDLVQVDYVGRMTIFGDPRERRDAKHLLPVNVPAGTTQQFWVTVHVPEDAEPGLYTGTIKVALGNAAPQWLTLKVTVLPFNLADPSLLYAIYHYGHLNDGEPTTGFSEQTPAQLAAHYTNMKAHGISCPEIRAPFDEEKLTRMFEIREQAGLDMKTLLYTGIGVGRTEPEDIPALQARLTQFMDFARGFGFEDIYFYGQDEATGERLKAERPAWEAAHEVGAKIWVSCGPDFYPLVGDLLDMPNIHGSVAHNVEDIHQFGYKMLNYMNPQCGTERADVYRQNYGLYLWKTGFDGACDFAYQVDFGTGGWLNEAGWDDFNTDPSQRYRDHNMIYSTLDGVIDTIQWEGFREGVDDVRYLTTLQNLIERAKASEKPAARQLAEECESWVTSLPISTVKLYEYSAPGSTPPGDLDAVRTQMIDKILQLRQALE